MKNKIILTFFLLLVSCALFQGQAKAQAIWGVSIIAWDDQDTQIAGLSGTYLDYYAGYYYDPWVNGCLYSTNDPEHCYSQGQVTGYADIYPAEVLHPTIYSTRNRTYCTYSDHRVWAYYYVAQYNNWWDAWGFSNFSPGPTNNNVPWYGQFSYIYRPRLIRLGWTQACHYVPPPPPPTSTPTPTATPTPLSASVNSVSFAGNYAIKRFDSVPRGQDISNPTWQKGSPGNSMNPVAYTRGKAVEKMKLSANFTITPNPGQNVNMNVRVKYSNNVIAMTSGSIPVTNSSVDVNNLGLTSELESVPTVKKGAYTFTWEVSFDNGQTWSSAGNTDHTVYWIYDDIIPETSGCETTGNPLGCLFVNNVGRKGYNGLFDKALEKAIDELTPATQTPDDIAKFLAYKIDDQIQYNPSDNVADGRHPLEAYTYANGVQCAVNANLLRGLLRSIGINNSEAVYVWGGKPSTTDKRETGGLTYGYKVVTTSSSSGGSSSFYYSFQAIRPASNDIFNLPKDPNFTFHAMVKVWTLPDSTASNLSARYYDPSYAKRLADNMTSYPDYPYINNDLKFRKAANLDDPDPKKGKFVKNDQTKPFVVRDLSLNSCLPNGGTCNPAFTKIAKKTVNNLVAASPRTTVFDDQGVATIAVWRPGDGVWYIHNEYENTNIYFQFGAAGDKLMPADYDGDGITDYAVYRSSNSTIYIWQSETQTLRTATWTVSADKPVIGDFDGDGKNDIAFYRSDNGSQWNIIRSSDGVLYSLVFGAIEDKPVSGDFDGDGKTDLAVYRPSTGTWWWWSSTMGTWNSQQFGLSEDIPTPGDYNGDGKTDFSVYRPSNNRWYFLYSGSGSYSELQIGDSKNLIPVPGDYDGDAMTDAAVWIPSSGQWIVKNSSDGTITTNYWGGGSLGDLPIAAAYSY